MRYKIILLTILLAGSIYNAQAQENGSADSTAVLIKPISKNALLDFCFSLKGIRYKWAGGSKKGFDCSGFVMYVFQNFGIAINHSSKDLAETGEKIELVDARPGDLLIFTGTKKKDRTPGHVGIVISEPGEPLQFIQSSSSRKKGGVIVTDYAESYYPVRFLQARRVADIE